MARQAYQLLLASEPAIEVVGVASDGESAVSMALAVEPTVVVMGAQMPQVSGLEAARAIRRERPGMGIVLLSTDANDESLREFLTDSPGGKAYLLKQSISTVERLVRTIQDVAEGLTVLDSHIAHQLTNERSPLEGLTHRELEVLASMAKGYSNAAIGDALCIQPKTVEYHINNIFSKLEISEPQYHARVRAVLTFLSAPPPSYQEDPASAPPILDGALEQRTGARFVA